MEEQTASPVPDQENERELLNFAQAAKVVFDGGRITKVEWGNEQFFGQLIDNRLQIHKPNGVFYDWVLSDGDLGGEDYYVL